MQKKEYKINLPVCFFYLEKEEAEFYGFLILKPEFLLEDFCY